MTKKNQVKSSKEQSLMISLIDCHFYHLHVFCRELTQLRYLFKYTCATYRKQLICMKMFLLRKFLVNMEFGLVFIYNIGCSLSVCLSCKLGTILRIFSQVLFAPRLIFKLFSSISDMVTFILAFNTVLGHVTELGRFPRSGHAN